MELKKVIGRWEKARHGMDYGIVKMMSFLKVGRLISKVC